ncbi:MAG: phytanoyl-CoA dioxygenase family protein [Armatimonadetes bacterium]|nr:phytanoyl-CoA dioxygenase family protein [Armatimonadota bacterium]
MSQFTVTPDQIARFQQDGYLIVPHLFDAEEMGLMLQIARADRGKQTRAVPDAQGGQSKIWLTSDTDREDIYNAFCHSRRVAGTMEKLLGDEVYLYHYKMTIKEPGEGGAWEWHQDYGYWYNNGCLFPDMASCYIAVDPAHRANGCLQVIRGSHRLGRIDHDKVGGQTGADAERVAQALEQLELVYCEMQPGDALFFHANALHRSDPNRSDEPRWGFICCYTTRHNPCRDLPGHPSYRPLALWDDARIRELGTRQWAEMQGQ